MKHSQKSISALRFISLLAIVALGFITIVGSGGGGGGSAPPLPQTTYYLDDDGDGYGDASYSTNLKVG